MANSAQARKRVRQSERRRVSNMSMNSKMRTFLKSFRSAVKAKDKDKASETFNALVKFFGRLISRKLLHKNKAARLTSQMNQKIKEMS